MHCKEKWGNFLRLVSRRSFFGVWWFSRFKIWKRVCCYSFFLVPTNKSVWVFFLWLFLKSNIPARFFTGKIRLVQTATFPHIDKKSMFWQRSDDKLQQLSLILITKKNWRLKFKISVLEFSENNFYSDLSIRGKTSAKFVTKKPLKAELKQKHFDFRKTFYPIPGIAIVPHSKVKVLS